jgi:CBS domain containing-hemolysin-like protein
VQERAAVLPTVASSVPGGAPDVEPWIGLLVALVLVLVNGFFVAAEFALVKVRPTQIEPFVERGELRAKVAQNMITHLDAYLSATQLGITLASLALGWIGEPAFAWLLEPVLSRIPGMTPALNHSVSLSVAFITISALHIVLGELAPKSLAIRKPEPTTLWVSLPLYAFYKLTYPAIWVLNHAANALLRLVGIEPVSEADGAQGEDELRRLLGSKHAAGISHAKREIIDNVFDLSRRTARQVMVPRADVVFLSTKNSLETNLSAARASGHTRFPVCHGQLDSVFGLLHIKDLFQRAAPPDSIEELARGIDCVPETTTLEALLRQMRSRHAHMAAVVDEHGGVSGIITLENVIEEIVGSIEDEFDQELPEVVQLTPGVYRVAGKVLVQDLEREIGIELSDRDEDTIGGVVLSEIGRSPKVGDQATLGSVRFEVLVARAHRILWLEVRVTPGEEPGC